MSKHRLANYLYWTTIARRAHENSWKYRDPAETLPWDLPEEFRMGHVAACQRISANAAEQARKVAGIRHDFSFG